MKVACKRKLFLIQLFLAKSDWDFFAKHVISSVETVVSEIKDKKPVKTDISIFLFYINSFRNYSTFFVIQGPQLGHAQHQKPRFFSLQLPVPQKAKQTIILTMNCVSKKSLNAELPY